MKKIIAIVSMLAVFTACKSTKKNQSASAPANTTPAVTAKPANGIYAPGDEELNAIRKSHADATMDQLAAGYKIYTEGACIKCHGAKDIYKRESSRWPQIIDNMAKRANLSQEDKDAVYRYVLSVKAVQGQ